LARWKSTIGFASLSPPDALTTKSIADTITLSNQLSVRMIAIDIPGKAFGANEP